MLDRKLYQIVKSALGEEYFSNYCQNFQTRLITQKALYLLTHCQNSTLQLKYKWNFYLHGPYSSEIAHIIYYMNDFLPVLRDSQIPLAPEEQIEIKQFKSFLKDMDKKLKNTLNKGEICELLATFLYLQKDIGKDSSMIFEKISKLKPTIYKKLRPGDEDIVSTAIGQFSLVE
jgi:uncharacterized protein YwgA